MRITFLIFSILCSMAITAQNDVSKDIKRIISDSSNKFSSFKGGIKYSNENDLDYHSILTINGTKENTISVNTLASTYLAIISDSLRKEEAQKLIMLWKDKIILILGNKIKIDNIKAVPGALITSGYMFHLGSMTIFLSQSKRFSDLHQVDLSFQILNISF